MGLRACRAAWLAVLAVLAVCAPAGAAVRRGPDGPAFYRPPAALVPGPPGSVVWAQPAQGLPALPDAARTVRVLYRSRSLTGAPIVVSGTVAFPRGTPPAGGWATASWGHVTTGAADSCAPSATRPDSPERERMTRGDVIAGRLLRAGLVVARSDYEGIGTPGRHPYLIGASLARSLTDVVRAARRLDRRVGTRWAAAGHSEGGLAALWAGQEGERIAPELDLRAVAALAPPSHMTDYLRVGRAIPVTTTLTAGLSSLAGLVLDGAAVAAPQLGDLYRAGALSPAAVALLPHVDDRCLVELDRADSWGGLAPAAIPGPRVRDAEPLLYDVLDANDPRALHIAGVPVRLDQGTLDPVVPAPFAEELLATYRARGADAELHRWPAATHQTITGDAHAAPAVVAWLAARLR